MKRKLRIQQKKAVRYKKELDGLARSFVYAFRGFRFAVGNERNMRVHLTVAAFVIQFAVLYRLQPIQYAILCLLFGLMIAAEMINTAIEALVNLQTESYNHLARIAKDVAAGAVLVLAVTSVVIGCIFFLHPKRLLQIAQFLLAHPLGIAILAAELVVGLLFIFFWNSRGNWKKKN